MQIRQSVTVIQSRFAGLLVVLFLCVGVGGAAADDSAMQTALKGTWKSTCMDLGSGVYIMITMSFDGAGKATDKTVFYSDPACQKPTEMIKTNQTTYKLGNKVNIGDQEAYEFDVTISKWQLEQYGSVLKRGGAVPTLYDIIAVADDKLYTSGLLDKDEAPLVDPANRPSTLDKKNYYTRQK